MVPVKNEGGVLEVELDSGRGAHVLGFENGEFALWLPSQSLVITEHDAEAIAALLTEHAKLGPLQLDDEGNGFRVEKPAPAKPKAKPRAKAKAKARKK